MTKMRVHELAKELGMDNKSLLDILSRKNIEVKSHMSTLEDDVVADIRREARRSAADSAKGDAVEAAPKKKNIVQVFRPQNIKNGAKAQGGRLGQRLNQGRPGQRPAVDKNAAADPAAKSARPQGAATVQTKPVRLQGTDAPETRQTRPQEAAPVQAQQIQQVRPQEPAPETRQARPQEAAPVKTPAQTAESHKDSRREIPKEPQKDSRREIPKDGQGDGQRRERYQRDGQGDGQRRERYQRDSQGDGQRRERYQRYGQGDGQRRERYQRDSQGDSQRRERYQRDGQGDGQRRERYQRDGQGRERYQKDGQRDGQGDGQRRERYQGDSQKGSRGERGDRNDRTQRGQGRQNDRRNDRDSMSAPLVEQQKTQRNKSKDKEKDYKKKELRDEEFENKGKKGKKTKPVAEVKKPQQKQAVVEEIKQIILPEVLTIKELADKMKVVPSVIVKKLFMQGKIVNVNQEIDYDTAEEIAMEFDVLCEKEEVVDVIEELLKEEEEAEETMEKRPPVVCVMGHVDHGKTSLLDAIRHSNVIDREAGGITQHIGAYVVEANGEKISFLDTPGHEAFTAMRMRGANATDIAILVVAADDGVMPQTVEAINHAKAAGIEIIVAVNKIDKPSANVERVKQEMTEYGLIAEDWGGSTIFVPVSAHTKEGIPELLEMILLTAEMLELKANANRAARGLVIEAKLDKGKGSVATVLVQKGTLHVGDAIAVGSAHGKVRAMMDDKGRRLKEAGPSQPVEILGLNDVPNAGEVFVGCATEKEARNFAETFIAQNKVKLLEETKSKMSLDDLFSQIQEGNLKELNIVVKADVQGSVEALKQSLLKLSNDEVVIKIIHGGVGAINESDVSLASASNAIIIGFNVRPDVTAKEIAEREGVDLRLYRVIYNAIEDVEAAMKGMLDPVFEEKILGHAEVRQTFKASGVGTIAGSYVLDGIFERHCSVRLTRDGVVIFEGPLASLKRFKDDVKEVRAGYECGFVFENCNDIKEGDLVEAFKMVEVERK